MLCYNGWTVVSYALTVRLWLYLGVGCCGKPVWETVWFLRIFSASRNTRSERLFEQKVSLLCPIVLHCDRTCICRHTIQPYFGVWFPIFHWKLCEINKSQVENFATVINLRSLTIILTSYVSSEHNFSKNCQLNYVKMWWALRFFRLSNTTRMR